MREPDTEPINVVHRQPVRRVSLGVLTGVSLWRLVIVASALYGFSDATGWSENLEGLSQQASLLTGIVYIGLLIYPAVTGGTRHEPDSPWLRGATTVLLLLVAGTFFGIMGGDFDYLPFEHVYTPLLVLVDWIAVGRNQRAVRWWHPLTWVAFPLAYLAFFLSAGVYRSLYDFLDPRGDGFAFVIVALLAGVIAIGYLLYGIGKLRGALTGGNPPAPRPATTPPAGTGRSRPPRRLIVAAAVGALLVAGATGLGLFLSASGGASGSRAAQDWATAVDDVGAASELWRTTQGSAPNAQPVRDHWVTESHLVRRLPGRVAAYGLDTGEVAWEVPLTGEASDSCPSSAQQSENRVALLRMTGGDENNCGTVTVIDISAGREVFTTDLPPIEREEVASTDVPVVIGEFVLVGSKTGGHLLNLDTGRRTSVADEGRCREDAYAVFGELLLARVTCRERPGSDPALSGLRAYDAELEEQWTWQAPDDGAGKPMEIRNVLSADPLVVDVYRKSSDTVETLRADPKSDESVTLLTRHFSLRDGNAYLEPCDQRGIAHCQQVRVTDGKLILTTVPEQMNPDAPGAYPGMTSTEFRNELVALDIGTGKEAWRTGMVDGRAVHLVPTTDGSIAAYQSANPNDVPGLLLSVDPASGALAPLLPVGAESHEDEELNDHVRSGLFGADNQQAVWTGERFVIFRTLFYDSNTGQPEMVAFGRP